MTAQVPIYNLRSGTASKRPAASGLAFGQIAINYNHSDPAIYLRGSSDDLVKVAPVFVGSGAPNATPASGGASGNTVGEQWLDITGGDYVTKVWDGTAWRSPVITSALIKNGTIVDEDINASAGIAVTKLGNGALPTGITIASDNIVNGTIVNADINAAAAIALTKLDSGALPSGITVSSDNIVDGTIVNGKLSLGNSIVNADINSAAAIADTKLATITTAGKVNGGAVTSGTISGSTAINISGSIVTTSGISGNNVVASGTLAVGQSSAATFVELDLNGAFAQTPQAVAALDIDCSLGNYFTKTINGASTFTFSNVPSGRAYSFMIEITQTSGAITWPASVKFNTDTAPTLTAGRTHLFVFVTDDGGTRWRGAALVDYVN
jgi:hypothetical protein